MNPTSINPDLSENVTYNRPDFPVYIRRDILSTYPNYRFVSHYHEDFEFILVLEGRMQYEVNSHVLALRPGEGVFVNSHSLHFGFSDDHQECIFICARLNPALFAANPYVRDNYLKPLMKDPGFRYSSLSPAVIWQNEILEALKHLWACQEENGSPFYILGQFALILDNLYRHKDALHMSSENKDDIRLLTAMIGYVQENYENRLSVTDIASAGGCCKTKCSSLFQKYLHTSPVMYLNSYRLEQSIALLHKTDKTITEIAYECGFSGASYYCEIFRKYYRISPGEYRTI